MRWLWSFGMALLIVLSSFVLILLMIKSPQSVHKEQAVQVGHFVPMSKSRSDSTPRSRLEAPEPPPDAEPPKPQASQPVQAQSVPTVKLDISAPNLTSNISIQAQSMPSLSNVQVASAQAAPAAAPAVASAAPASMGQDSEVIPLNEVLPEYPDSARRRGIEGHVRLGFTINAQGRVENIEVLEASPSNVFNLSARRAAARWRFTPSRENGVPVPRRAEKTIEFKLTQGR